MKEGDILVQKDLANTFEMLIRKKEGSKAFYDGRMVAIADVVQDFGGSMTPDDLSRYEVTTDKPIWGEYHGYDIASMPPPSSGGVFMLQTLKLIDDFHFIAIRSKVV